MIGVDQVYPVGIGDGVFQYVRGGGVNYQDSVILSGPVVQSQVSDRAVVDIAEYHLPVISCRNRPPDGEIVPIQNGFSVAPGIVGNRVVAGPGYPQGIKGVVTDIIRTDRVGLPVI